jgi:hypothetical protein
LRAEALCAGQDAGLGGDPDDALDLVGQAERFGLSCCGGEHPRGGVFFAGGGRGCTAGNPTPAAA